MSSQGRIVASAAGTTVCVAGASIAALNAATIIVAVGAAAALGLAGYGVYCYLSKAGDKPQKPTELSGPPPETPLLDVDEPPILPEGPADGLPI